MSRRHGHFDTQYQLFHAICFFLLKSFSFGFFIHYFFRRFFFHTYLHNILGQIGDTVLGLILSDGVTKFTRSWYTKHVLRNENWQVHVKFSMCAKRYFNLLDKKFKLYNNHNAANSYIPLYILYILCTRDILFVIHIYKFSLLTDIIGHILISIKIILTFLNIYPI